jgi:hypothetical protein
MNIVIDDNLIRKARKLTELRTTRQIVNMALNLLVHPENRKGILRYITGLESGTAISSGLGETATRSTTPSNYDRGRSCPDSDI